MLVVRCWGRHGWAVLAAGMLAAIGCAESGTTHTAKKPVADDSPSLVAENPADKSQQRVADQNQDVAEGQTQAKAIEPSKQLVQLKATAPEKVRVGEAYTYEINVTNTSDQATVRNVQVQHTIPEGFEIQSSQPEAKTEQQQATWTISQLGPGETKKIEVTGLSDKEGSANACLSVTYTPTICIATQFVKPEIELSKEVPERAGLCDPIQAVYRITNHGTGTAKNLEVRDELPEGLKTSEGEQLVQFKVDELAPGKAQEFKVNLMASKAGEFKSRAVATSGDEEQSRSSETTTTVEAPQLEVALDGPSTEYIGRLVTYKLNVKNNGNAPAENVVLSLKQPEQLRYTRASAVSLSEASASANEAGQPTPAGEGSGSEQPAARRQAEQASAGPQPPQAADGTVQWQLGTVQPGQTAQATVSFSGRQPGDFDLQAVAAFACGAQGEKSQAEATTQTSLIALPALAISVVDTPDPVKVGEEVQYIVTVLNEGTAPDEQIKVIATLPESLEHVANSGQTKGTLEGNKITFEPVEKLNAGEEVRWTIRAKANKEGSSELSVDVSSKNQESTTAQEPTKLFQDAK